MTVEFVDEGSSNVARRCRAERRDELLGRGVEQLTLRRGQLCVVALELGQAVEGRSRLQGGVAELVEELRQRICQSAHAVLLLMLELVLDRRGAYPEAAWLPGRY